MKALYLLALVSAQALAWPWTTVDDCTAKYVPKAESNQGAKIVRTACLDKYQRKIDNDGLFDCIVDKVVTAKTDTAASMMVQLCRRENPPKQITDEELIKGFADFKKQQDKAVADFGKYLDCVKSMNGENNQSVQDFCIKQLDD